jgi:hypothetical protein
MGWLTSRRKEVKLGAHHEASTAAELIAKFCEVNNLAKPREDWTERLTQPADAPDTGLKQIEVAEDLRSVLNRHSIENASNTPDFVLARYLLGCLDAFASAVNEREQWYGRPMKHGVFENWLLSEGVTRAACDTCGQESCNPGAVGEACLLNKCPGVYRAVPR